MTPRAGSAECGAPGTRRHHVRRRGSSARARARHRARCICTSGVSVLTALALYDKEEGPPPIVPYAAWCPVAYPGDGPRRRDLGATHMSGWFHHWIIIDFYDPIWPNIAASILCAVWAVRRIKIHLRRHHQLVLRHFAFLHEKNADVDGATAVRVGALSGSAASGGGGRFSGRGKATSKT